MLLDTYEMLAEISSFFRAHSKTIGGLPLVRDTFLLQKQQTFDPSKNLERELSLQSALMDVCASRMRGKS